MVAGLKIRSADGGMPKPTMWRATGASALACNGTGISAWWTSKPIRVSRETSPSIA
jgi:hypothetical protein